MPSDVTKNDSPHAIPHLIATNLKLIPRTSEYLFPSGYSTPFSAWSKNKKKLDKLSGVSDWVIHDLRRTGRSRLANWQCCSPEIAERLLGHATDQTRLERIYNRWSHLPQMRNGLEPYEQRLAALIASARNPILFTPLASNPGPLQQLQHRSVAMANRFLSKAEVKAKIKLSYRQTKRLIDAGKFPKPLRLGPHQTSSTVYVETEVDAWMDEQMKRLRPE